MTQKQTHAPGSTQHIDERVLNAKVEVVPSRFAEVFDAAELGSRN